jgi:hypothetical protein
MTGAVHRGNLQLSAAFPRMFAWWHDRAGRTLVWVLPLVWTVCCWVNFHFPGDEYAGWVIGSVAGTWILMLGIVKNSGDINVFWDALGPALVAGAATMAVLGWLLDRLRAPLAILPLGTIPIASLMTWIAWRNYGSYKRLVGGMGSLTAVILPGINIGLTVTAVAAVLVLGAWRFASRPRGRPSGD